jgi:hypothetical protein
MFSFPVEYKGSKYEISFHPREGAYRVLNRDGDGRCIREITNIDIDELVKLLLIYQKKHLLGEDSDQFFQTLVSAEIYLHEFNALYDMSLINHEEWERLTQSVRNIINNATQDIECAVLRRKVA